MSEAVDHALIDRVLKRDLVNIQRRVAAGETISNAEREVLLRAKAEATAEGAQKISGEELCHLTGLTDKRHRQLAKQGYFPPPDNGLYDLRATFAGLVKYYREAAARKVKAGTLDAAKLVKEQAKARLAQLEVQQAEGQLLELAVVQHVCGSICSAFTARLSNFGDGLASICHNQPGDFVAQRINEGLRSALRELSKLNHLPLGKNDGN